jgi:mannose-1-phosphate guanylyltransferase
MKATPAQERCGIVLAGTKDNRLRSFIHYLRDSAAPKQYVNFIGTRSMLEHTLDRAERLVRRSCLYTVVIREHLVYPEVQHQLSAMPRETVLVEPDDLGSAPALLLPLLLIHKSRPNAAVAVFPADHFIVEEELFMTQVAMAFYMVEKYPTDVVLLGVEPDSDDADHSFILSDGEASASGARNVRLFVEKADAALTRESIASSGLWNTMTMVFRADTAVHLIRRFAPELYRALREIEAALGTRAERNVVERAFRRLPPLSFTSDVLQKCASLTPARIRALPVAGVFWSDWGSEERLVESLKRTGYFDRLKKTDDTRAQLG